MAFIRVILLIVPPRSQHVLDIIAYIEADPGQGMGVDLDVAGVNRPVGLTHYLDALPPQALITAATVIVRVKGEEHVINDGIFF